MKLISIFADPDIMINFIIVLMYSNNQFNSISFQFFIFNEEVSNEYLINEDNCY